MRRVELDASRVCAVGPRTRVRLARPSDLPGLLAAVDRDGFWREAGFRSSENMKALLRSTVEAQAAGVCASYAWLWAFTSREREDVWGLGYFCRVYRYEGEGLLGVFDRGKRGRALAAEAVILAHHLVFAALGFRACTGTLRPNNVEAYRLYARLGYRVTGRREEGDAPADAPPVILQLALRAEDFYAVKTVLRLTGKA